MSDLESSFTDKVQQLVESGGELHEIQQLAAIRKYVLQTLLKAPYSKIEEIERGEAGREANVPSGHRRGKHL